MKPVAPEKTRRGFLDVIIGLGSAVTGLALVLPALAYLWPAARRGGAGNVEVAGADGMTVGQSRMVQLGGKAVIVVRDQEGFRAYSAICTHLGCLVRWDGSRKEFLCPCHAAVFDAQGRVVSGPPPTALPEYRVKEVGGRVYVSAA
jgi:cytochrome b6-f complex iron-sulfur subunit